MLPQTMFPVVRDPSCACPPILINNTMFGGVWRIGTDGVMTQYINVGEAVPDLAHGDHLLLWGEITETASFIVEESITIGSVYPGQQAQTNWDLAGYIANFRADTQFANLHIQSAEGIIVSATVGLKLRFQDCALYLTDGDFSPDGAFNSTWTCEMEGCYVAGDPGVTEFMLGIPNGKCTIEVNNTEFRNLETRFGATTGSGAMRFFGSQFFNTTNLYFYSILLEGTGNKFFQGCRFYGQNNSAVGAVGVVHVAAGTDDLRMDNCNFRAAKGANDGYGIVFQDDTITGVIIANSWAQDDGPVTSMLYAAPAGITIRGPNSTFDGAAFVNVTVAP